MSEKTFYCGWCDPPPEGSPRIYVPRYINGVLSRGNWYPTFSGKEDLTAHIRTAHPEVEITSRGRKK